MFWYSGKKISKMRIHWKILPKKEVIFKDPLKVSLTAEHSSQFIHEMSTSELGADLTLEYL